MIPETISHYRIISKLGAGGMGEVYLAEDINLGRRVALKLLPARFTQDAERVRRFEQEARTASTLSHPNILTIYEIGQVQTEAGATHFIAMEYVEGQTLRQYLSKRRLKLNEAVEIARSNREARSWPPTARASRTAISSPRTLCCGSTVT